MRTSRRQFLATTALLAAGCRIRRDANFDGIVSTDARERADGVPTHTSLIAAIAAAPDGLTRPWRIRIARGRWYGKVVIDKPFIHLVGDDRRGSIVSFDAAAGHLRPDGNVWGTSGCASLIVRAPEFAATNLTIENTFDYVGEITREQPTLPPIGSNGAQAVALMLDTGADRSRFERVNLHGHQDTLFVDAGRSRFVDCTITGSVDFIFGAGRCLIDKSEIVSRYRPGKERQGFVVAPSTPSAQDFGIVLRQCRLTRESAVPDASVALGRPWRHARKFADGQYGDPNISSQAVFVSCWMDAHIDALGWEAMRYPTKDGARVPYDPADARLFEYASSGPGARRSATRRVLSADEATTVTVQRVLPGWRGA